MYIHIYIYIYIGNPVLKKDQSPVVARTIPEADVVKKGENFVLKSDDNIRVVSKAVKMSKSRGNVVNPDDVISTTGADALRLYLMFMGPLEQVNPPHHLLLLHCCRRPRLTSCLWPPSNR
jgi:hypothetical protein